MSSTRPTSGPDRPGAGSRRRRPLFWLLLVAFVVVPLVEIYVLVQVGQVIGAGWTILLLIADSVIGTWILRREGARAWRSLREALQAGRMPAGEIADGALIVVGGTLMLAPGFVSDVVGLALILPLTRPLFRRLLAAAVARRLVGGGSSATLWGAGPGATRGQTGQARRRPGPGSQGPVVRGEVVDDVGGDAEGPTR